MNAPLPKLYTQAELDAAVLEGSVYLAANLHEAFTKDDIDEAVELLQLKEHERPEGYVSSVGNALVTVPEKLRLMMRNPLPVAEMRAACILFLTECAEAEAQREQQAKRGAEASL